MCGESCWLLGMSILLWRGSGKQNGRSKGFCKACNTMTIHQGPAQGLWCLQAAEAPQPLVEKFPPLDCVRKLRFWKFLCWSGGKVFFFPWCWSLSLSVCKQFPSWTKGEQETGEQGNIKIKKAVAPVVDPKPFFLLAWSEHLADVPSHRQNRSWWLQTWWASCRRTHGCSKWHLRQFACRFQARQRLYFAVLIPAELKIKISTGFTFGEWLLYLWRVVAFDFPESRDAAN